MSAFSDELKQTVDDILLEFAPISERTVYKRSISRSGGSELLGRSVTVSEVDTVLDPQPATLRLGRSSPYLKDSALAMVDDWLFVLSVNTITRDEFLDKDTVLVQKDALGVEEVFRLIDFQDPGVNSVVVAYLGFYRSTDR